ncbi:MAG: hypothetical protein IPL95_16345 [Saprospiraceae bacterium]|nr:hypothetical protein [Saprospiraceae bacterium]
MGNIGLEEKDYKVTQIKVIIVNSFRDWYEYLTPILGFGGRTDRQPPWSIMLHIFDLAGTTAIHSTPSTASVSVIDLNIDLATLGTWYYSIWQSILNFSYKPYK